MEWKLTAIRQETEHRFLNFFTFYYTVTKDGEDKDYPYFVASRNQTKDLYANPGSAHRPDGVLIMAVKQSPEPAVLLIEQFRPALNTRVVEFPAGLCDEGDTDILATAHREIIEETGFVLSDVSVFCPPSPTSCGCTDEMVGVVMGTVKEKTDSRLEPFEDIDARFVPLREVRTLLADETKTIALNVRLCLLYLLEKHGL